MKCALLYVMEDSLNNFLQPLIAPSAGGWLQCFSEMLNIISMQQFVGHLHITCICKNVILSQDVFTTSIYYNRKCCSNFVLQNAERISMTYLGPISELLGELDFGGYFRQN